MKRTDSYRSLYSLTTGLFRMKTLGASAMEGVTSSAAGSIRLAAAPLSAAREADMGQAAAARPMSTIAVGDIFLGRAPSTGKMKTNTRYRNMSVAISPTVMKNSPSAGK